MTKTGTAPELIADGQQIGCDAGPATIVVHRIRPDAVRLSIRHRSTGAEIPELCRSYPTEREARHAARVATTLFLRGWSVNDMLDLIAAFTT